MILQAFFGTAQTGVGFQFYDSTGTLIGSRTTAGIVSLPEAGAYAVDVAVPASAVGVFWDTDTSEASEDLRDAIAAENVESRLTAARAGYLDKLNVTGTLAHSDAAATYRATGFAVPGDAMTLTSGERSTLATAIEAALINEGDGQQLIDAILQVINSNLDLPALELTAIANAVRSELATELARIDVAVSSVSGGAAFTLADIADAVWDEALAGHVGAGSAGEKLGSIPLASAIASQVRTELSTELARIDTAISSRLASANYSAPIAAATIASQVRTELSTELARIDAAISTRLASAGYTAPASAAAISAAVWDEVLADHTSAGSTGAALDGAGGGGSSPSAADIADAVWDELIGDHQSAGSTGEQLQAAGASGDPWATTVPGAYADGSAGAAVGRLNNTPADAPVIVIPDPSGDPDLCVTYLDTEDMTGRVISGLKIKIELKTASPAVSTGGKVVSSDVRTMIEDFDNPGRYLINLEKGLAYKAVENELFGVNGKAFWISTEDTLNLAD